MTEAEWLTATDPTAMLEFLKGKASDRKLRLFACACCRVVMWESFTHERSRRAVEVAERYADGLEDDATLERAHSMAYDALASYQHQHHYRRMVNRDGLTRIEWRLHLAAESAHLHRPFLVGRLGALRHDPDSTVVAPALVRDVFGVSPATPLPLDPRWQTETVVALATGIYADRAFDRMPILADALEEAGCDHTDILNHCRGDGPHVRGCWVLDLVLGKE